MKVFGDSASFGKPDIIQHESFLSSCMLSISLVADLNFIPSASLLMQTYGSISIAHSLKQFSTGKFSNQKRSLSFIKVILSLLCCLVRKGSLFTTTLDYTDPPVFKCLLIWNI